MAVRRELPAWRRAVALLRGVLTVLAAVVLLIEEWGWRPLTRFAARISRWPPIARIEARIQAASPRVALALFLVPATLLFPLKLLALGFIERGDTVFGIAIIVAAKLAGTAFVGRLFVICEPQLMTFPWFARALLWWRATKARVRNALEANVAWKMLRRTRRLFESRIRRWWRRSKR